MLVFLVLMYYFDLYNSSVLTNRREVVTRLVGVLGTHVCRAGGVVLRLSRPEPERFGALDRHPGGCHCRTGLADLFFRAQPLCTVC